MDISAVLPGVILFRTGPVEVPHDYPGGGYQKTVH